MTKSTKTKANRINRKYTKKQLKKRLDKFCKEHGLQDARTRVGKGGRVLTIQCGFTDPSEGNRRWANKLSVLIDSDSCVLLTSRGSLSELEDKFLDLVEELV